jgi:nucleoid-associated protein YgaU
MDFFKKGEEKPAENQQNAQQKQNQGQQQQTEFDTYTVKSGDSLSKIAKQYYGDPMQWPKIFDANKDQIQNPDLIQPGQTFKTPKNK